MRGKRARFLRNLVKKADANMLFSIRNYFGEFTENMNEVQIYRAAKKLWPVYGRKEKWGCQ